MRKFVLLFLSLAAAAAGAADDTVKLDTPTTTMTFRRDADGVWLMPYYGAKIEDAADAEALEGDPCRHDGRIGAVAGQAKPASYSVYGAKEFGIDANKSGGLCVKHDDGTMASELVGLGAEWIDDKTAAKHLVLPMKDSVHDFLVLQHFRVFDDTDAVETWTEFSNRETGAVELYRMDSAALTFPLLADEFHFMSLTGQWGCENQISESELPRGQAVVISSRNGVRDAWFANPAFMLSVGRRADECSGTVIGGVLAWSGAWSISAHRDYADLLELRLGADNANGAYRLEPGSSVTAPKAVLVRSDRGKGAVSRELHRWARNHRLPHGRELRDIVLNSWEGAYFDFDERRLVRMMDGLAEMGGEMFVVDDGWFGNGRYARDNDRNGLGDWRVNARKLPRGLGHLAGEAKSRGLKFGLWVEPEMVNVTSELYTRHPEWAMRCKGRPLGTGRGGTQCVLDFTNPDVVDNISSQLGAILDAAPGISYFKWDANANFFNVGSPTSGRDQNLYFDYTAGLYEVLKRLRAKRPDLIVQACSSGGGRMEYGFLGYADEFWPSDDTDARERVFIQWGAGMFYPANAIAAHVTVSPNHQTMRETPLKYRFDVAMSARLGLELDPRKMSAEDTGFAKRCIAVYKSIRPVVQQGELYRLVSPYGRTYAAQMHVSTDCRRAVVFVWGLNRGPCKDFIPPVRLDGLAPDLRYRVTEVNLPDGAGGHCGASGSAVSGQALMAAGLPVYIGKGDYDSAVFVLEAQ
ncbi:MAG: alpha-galactosidase [Kiritimatiellae bacterium]|nr:alpha-galactosidase [Kiritimatiellia bacterium]